MRRRAKAETSGAKGEQDTGAIIKYWDADSRCGMCATQRRSTTPIRRLNDATLLLPQCEEAESASLPSERDLDWETRFGC